MPLTDTTIPSAHIDFFVPEVGAAERQAVLRVFDSNYLNDGDVARELEARIATRIGVRHCVAVTNGTSAIALALLAAGIGPGDEVIVSDLTFIATANAVRLAGAKVRLVDIEPRRFGLDADRVAEAIGPETRAVVATDVNGRGVAYQALEALCRDRGLVLVCDSTEGLGSRYAGRCLGAFGTAGCFSFSANKTVCSGQGGMISTNDSDLYHRILELKDQGRRAQGTGGDDLHPVIGYNFKYTNLQAAVALAQLDRLDGRLDRFRQRNRWYRELLDGCPGVAFPGDDDADGEVTQWTDVLVDRRQEVSDALAANRMGSRAFWFPLHSQAPYALPDGEFANAIDVSRRGLWLPSSFGLTHDDAVRVAGVVRAVLGG